MTLTYERLHEVLKYTPFDGLFRWKINSNNHQVHIGDIAGTKSNGYIEISIDKKRYKAHRLAWFYVYGYMPEKEIDHIKRNKRDNRIRRLREASSQCQKRNIGIAKNNTSGVKGVSWYTKKKRWCAEIKVNKKRKCIGFFKEFHNAVCARLAGEQCLNWNACDNNTTAYQYVQKMVKEGVI